MMDLIEKRCLTHSGRRIGARPASRALQCLVDELARDERAIASFCHSVEIQIIYSIKIFYSLVVITPVDLSKQIVQRYAEMHGSFTYF